MHLTKKIPLYPNKKTQDALWNISHLCTNLWNCALEQRKDKNSYGKVNIYSQKKELTLIKKEFKEYKIPSSQVLQNVLFSLDRSYKQFFTKWKNGDKDVKPPKFKSKKYFFSQDYSQYKTSFFIDQEQKILQLAYGKNKKEWLSIPFNEKDLIDCGNFKTCIISYDDMNKKWYASITYVFEEVRYQKNNHSIYFDPGAKTTLTGITSVGEFIEYDINPLRKLNINTYKFIDKLISQRDKLNKKRQYKAWSRLNKRIKKLFRKISTRSKVFLHTLANRILDNHPEIQQFYVGNWKKSETKSNHELDFVNKRINRAVQNNLPLQKLIGYLTYKAKMLGKKVEKFNERGTTRTCAKCRKQHKDGVSPNERVFKCVDTKECGFQYSRDHQSCLNFIYMFESALWRRLVEQDNLPTRSKRITISPFACKTQCYSYRL